MISMTGKSRKLTIVYFSPHDGGVMYEWEWPHYLSELQAAGNTVVECNPNAVLGRHGTPAENAEILKEVALAAAKQYGNCMLLAAQGRDNNLDPGVIDLLRSKGVVCVNIGVDGYFERSHVRNIGRHFDVNWVTHHSAEDISRLGCNVLYLPMAANPKFFAPHQEKRDLAVGFVGSKYGARPLYAAAIAAAGVPMRIRGRGWSGDGVGTAVRGAGSIDMSSLLGLLSFPAGRTVARAGLQRRMVSLWQRSSDDSKLDGVDIGDEISLEAMVEFYGRCAMSLGVGELQNTYVLRHPLYQYRLRDFEAPMIGCAHLVRRSAELEECFTDGKEMLFYDSVEECVDKAKFYLSEGHEKDVLEIGRAARARSVKEHTWMKRFQALWTYLGM
jgi:hypothetical protein